MTLRSNLLRRGYFPEPLPPVFCSAPLADFVDQGNIGNDYLTTQSVRTRPALHNATKRGCQRRLFSVPNPIAAADCALFIDTYWGDITKHISASPFSISMPTDNPSGTRALTITPHSEIASCKSQRLAASRYIARTDISRFFPSIYIHSLPWSFHGKYASKRDKSPKSRRVFFNQLDFILRQAQDGQTVGIPVGPDWSRVIAETLATAVDQEFCKRVKGKPPIVRHVDDIWIGANTRDEAEKLLYTYRECLREFELDINELKTSIVSATDDLTPPWPLDLENQLQSQFAGVRHVFAMKPRRDTMFTVLDQVFSVANRQNDDGIIKFAIRRLDAMHAWDEAWEILESFLVRCFVNYPHSIDYVARVVAWRKRRNKDIDLRKWSGAVCDSLSRHSKHGNDSEVCWALWLAKEININLRKECVDAVWTRCGPFPLLLLLACIESGNTRARMKEDCLLERFGKSPFAGPLWIVGYEAARRDWIARAKLKNDACSGVFDAMLGRDVSFYDDAAVPRVFEERNEHEWAGIDEAIEDISGEYDPDEDDSDEDWPEYFE